MILIANRGEIACRVISTARKLGIKTVAVYSDADAGARHVRMADHAIAIGPGPAAESYLLGDKILAACARSGATMVHPGYGFLSENASFSKACREAGIKFIGPSPESIEGLGNKSAGKALAQKLGVPCLPGYSGMAQDDASLETEAIKVGFPLMIKAAAGGGGRGMRRVDEASQLGEAIRAAKIEALSGFGSDQLLIERLVQNARHIEIQVFGDQHGNVIHLGERDCSTQRRNQKILEEAPAPGLAPGVRQAMGEAAIRLAKGVNYEGAGTIEFLFEDKGDGHGEFFFLEMNTRLQVEHPVTEAVTGLDLVALQIAIAQGRSLNDLGVDCNIRGHSIEARLCAEDAWAGFVPQPGAIASWSFPDIEGLRIDHGLADKAEIPRYYDSMIAKLIAYGPTREIARQRLIAGLEQTRVLGLTTNRDYLLACLQAEPFSKPVLSTRWLDQASPGFSKPEPDAVWRALAAALLVHEQGLGHGVLAQWSNNGFTRSPLKLSVRDHTYKLSVACDSSSPGSYRVGEEQQREEQKREEQKHDEKKHEGKVQEGMHAAAPGQAPVLVQLPVGTALAKLSHAIVDGLSLPLCARLVRSATGALVLLDAMGVNEACQDLSMAPPDKSSAAGSGSVMAKMHGAVRGLAVAVGQDVKQGDRLLSLEAMKMEHSINAPCAGTIHAIHVQEAQQVAPGRLMIEITPRSAE